MFLFENRTKLVYILKYILFLGMYTSHYTHFEFVQTVRTTSCKKQSVYELYTNLFGYCLYKRLYTNSASIRYKHLYKRLYKCLYRNEAVVCTNTFTNVCKSVCTEMKRSFVQTLYKGLYKCLYRNEA